jgi:hypothetical protein
MQPPELNLTSVYAKLDRAEEHFKAVDSEIKAWLDSGRYEAFFERGTQQTRMGISVLRTGPPPDLVRWSVIIGDCINNLRATLDHLVNAFAKVPYIYTPARDKERLTFIIIDDPSEFTKALNKTFGGLRPDYADALTLLQPFNRKHPILPPLLGIIRDLSNADKHRLLQVAGAGVARVQGNLIHNATLGKKNYFVNPDPIQNNDIICMIESSEPDPDLRLENVSGVVEISIWHGLRDGSTDPLERRTAYFTLLTMLIAEVKYVINLFKGLA